MLNKAGLAQVQGGRDDATSVWERKNGLQVKDWDWGALGIEG